MYFDYTNNIEFTPIVSTSDSLVSVSFKYNFVSDRTQYKISRPSSQSVVLSYNSILPRLGCNTGTGNSAVSQPRVAQVRVRFRNSGPEAVPQPVTAVSRVFAVLSVHCQPKSRSVMGCHILN